MCIARVLQEWWRCFGPRSWTMSFTIDVMSRYVGMCSHVIRHWNVDPSQAILLLKLRLLLMHIQGQGQGIDGRAQERH